MTEAATDKKVKKRQRIKENVVTKVDRDFVEDDLGDKVQSESEIEEDEDEAENDKEAEEAEPQAEQELYKEPFHKPE